MTSSMPRFLPIRLESLTAKPMQATIFYSWQSDTKAAANRTLIQDALEGAVKELRADGSISVEPVIERDTKGVPSAPDIRTTILEKIDASAVIVADVTIVGRGDGAGPTPCAGTA